VLPGLRLERSNSYDRRIVKSFESLHTDPPRATLLITLGLRLLCSACAGGAILWLL